jgi:hypothetical protein
MNFNFILCLVSWVQIPIPPPHSKKKPAIYSGLFCWAKERDLNPGFLFMKS